VTPERDRRTNSAAAWVSTHPPPLPPRSSRRASVAALVTRDPPNAEDDVPAGERHQPSAPPPHQLVRQPAAHHLVQRPRRELLSKSTSGRAGTRSRTGELAATRTPRYLFWVAWRLRSGSQSASPAPSGRLLQLCSSSSAGARNPTASEPCRRARALRVAPPPLPPCTRHDFTHGRVEVVHSRARGRTRLRSPVVPSRLRASRCRSPRRSASDSVRRLRSRSINTRVKGGSRTARPRPDGIRLPDLWAPVTRRRAPHACRCPAPARPHGAACRTAPRIVGRLEELTRLTPPLEFARVRKWYASPSRSPVSPWRSSRIRVPKVPGAQSAAHARWSSCTPDGRRADDRGVTSRLSSCSRTFSSSPFIAMTVWVNRPHRLAFDPIVLTSRSSSCARNPSCFPHGRVGPKRLLARRQCVRSRTSSSVMSTRSAIRRTRRRAAAHSHCTPARAPHRFLQARESAVSRSGARCSIARALLRARRPSGQLGRRAPLPPRPHPQQLADRPPRESLDIAPLRRGDAV